ncbi:uncharacterized protein [Aegilops tauschii subsp. strangulata]|uniref:uncharacterized protein n=1 Tax=Aegilops tauschii subsp. strangulata TaxID=200361 RepID=UPI003CC842CD
MGVKKLPLVALPQRLVSSLPRHAASTSMATCFCSASSPPDLAGSGGSRLSIFGRSPVRARPGRARSPAAHSRVPRPRAPAGALARPRPLPRPPPRPGRALKHADAPAAATALSVRLRPWSLRTALLPPAWLEEAMRFCIPEPAGRAAQRGGAGWLAGGRARFRARGAEGWRRGAEGWRPGAATRRGVRPQMAGGVARMAGHGGDTAGLSCGKAPGRGGARSRARRRRGGPELREGTGAGRRARPGAAATRRELWEGTGHGERESGRREREGGGSARRKW